MKAVWNWLCSWNMPGLGDNATGTTVTGIVASIIILTVILIGIDALRGKKSILF